MTNTIELINHKTKIVGFCGAAQSGKAQPLTAEILTPNGYITMGSVLIGDYVIGRNGLPTKVIGVYPQGIRQCYRITFSDNTSTECDGEHLWTVYDMFCKKDSRRIRDQNGKSTNQRYCTVLGKEKVLTTNELFTKQLSKKVKMPPGHIANRWRYKIPMCDPVQFNFLGEPKIDPYLLGALLGDGCLTTGTPVFVNSEPDICDKIRILANDLECNMVFIGRSHYRLSKTNDITNRHILNPLTQLLRSYNLCVDSSNKYIPDDYKFGSIATRISIIQGLMDTDGYIDAHGHASYSTTSKQLADDIQFIIQSLGGTTTIGIRIGQYKTQDRDIIHCKDCYTLQIKCNIPLVTSKKHLQRYAQKDINIYRFIQNIELIDNQQTQCIAVADPEQLYLTNDFIVTHNSTSCQYFTGLCWKISNLVNKFDLTSTGKLRIYDLNGNQFPEGKLLDVVGYSNDPELDSILQVCSPNPNNITQEINFGDALKQVCSAMFGLDPALCWGSDKDKATLTKYTANQFIELIGSGRYPFKDHKGTTQLSIREILQLVGTEIGRRIDPCLWVDRTVESIYHLIQNWRPMMILIGDVRFDTEIDAIQKMGGTIIGLKRKPKSSAGSTHASEQIDKLLPRCNYIIDNQLHTIEAQCCQLFPIFKEIMKDGK